MDRASRKVEHIIIGRNFTKRSKKANTVSKTFGVLYPKDLKGNLRTKTKTKTKAITKRSGEYHKAMSEWTFFFTGGACRNEMNTA